MSWKYNNTFKLKKKVTVMSSDKTMSVYFQTFNKIESDFSIIPVMFVKDITSRKYLFQINFYE